MAGATFHVEPIPTVVFPLVAGLLVAPGRAVDKSLNLWKKEAGTR
jgi:hypothetical protein